MADVDVRIGGSAEAMGQRFIEAWKRAEDGDATASRPVVTFESFEAFVATLSNARVDVLRRLGDEGPAPSINAFARLLGRPYRRVHDDVTALIEAGLIEREGTQIALAADGAQTRISFRRETA